MRNAGCESFFVEDSVSDIVARFFRRSDAAKNAGGISCADSARGVALPEGYWYDDVTMFWIPPGVGLL